MAPILNAQGLSKRYGAKALFENISLTISPGEGIGLIGPNGSGKSTLLEILSGRLKPDRGEVALRKGTRLAQVRQISEFPWEATCRSVVERALEESGAEEEQRGYRSEEALHRAGFMDYEAHAGALSGGWRKRLAIVEALVRRPEILLLDEPTNHLDIGGIEWLEGLLGGAGFAWLAVSHDRYFLERVAGDMAELSRYYEGGFLRVKGNYSKFLEAKEEYLAAQGKKQDALANRVHTELEWLRRGPKARATKSKSRIGKAHEMIGELAELRMRTRTAEAKIDFTASERQTKQLIALREVTCAAGGRALFRGLSFTVTSGMRAGLAGPNGSGKTTLLRLLRGEIEPSQGKIARAEGLRIVYFDQTRQLDPELSLRRALAPESDGVIYKGQVIHVASWAARFLFTAEDLNRPVGRLSGGERARILIAQLMLQPADVLLLDEPTNDLDIPTLEILEESLLEYPGALVLVTHDRYMLDRVSTVVVGLDGQGGAERFADYQQWEAWMKEAGERGASVGRERKKPAAAAEAKPSRKSGSRDGREAARMEKRIEEAEAILTARRAALEDPAIASDAPRLQAAYGEMQAAQSEVDALYARWSEMEKG